MRKFLALSLAVLAILSCSRIGLDQPEAEKAEEGPKKVNLTIIASNPSDPDTRTEMNGTTPLWSVGDNLGVSSLILDENEDVFPFSTLTADPAGLPGITATFSGPLQEDYAGKVFRAWYPAEPTIRMADQEPEYGTSSSMEIAEYYYYGGMDQLTPGVSTHAIDNDEVTGAVVLVSPYQRPSATSFDGASDVLASKPFNLDNTSITDDGESLSATLPDVQFARLVSIVKLVLNPGERFLPGQHPKSVNMYYYNPEAETETYLSGPALLEFPDSGDGEAFPVLHPLTDMEDPDSEVSLGSTSEVNAILDGYTLSEDNPIYLVVFPQVLRRNGELTIAVEDSENYFSIFRTITLPTDIALNPGKITTLNISLDNEETDFGQKSLPVGLEMEESVVLDQYDDLSVSAQFLGDVPGDPYIVYDPSKVWWTLTQGDETITYTSDDTALSFDAYEGQVFLNLSEVSITGTYTLTVNYGESENPISASCSVTIEPGAELPDVDWYDWFTEGGFINKDGNLRVLHAGRFTDNDWGRISGNLKPFSSDFKGNGGGYDFSAFQYFTGLTKIPANAFQGCFRLSKIVLPGSVTAIEQNAFVACSALGAVNLENVTDIGVYAFFGCAALQTVDLSNATEIGSYAFSGCEQLSSVQNLNRVETIGYQAFYDCSSLTGIDLPGTLSTIGSQAFTDTGLTSVTIPASVQVIGSLVFEIPGMRYIIMEGTVPPALGDADAFGDPELYSFPIYVPEDSVQTYVDTWRGEGWEYGEALVSRIRPVSELSTP